jgi:hypothetical protein
MILDFIQAKITIFCINEIEMRLFLFRPINRTAKDIALKLFLSLSVAVGFNQPMKDYKY